MRLGNLCQKIGSGATPRGGKEVYQSEGVAFIRSQNIYNEGFEDAGLVRINDAAAEDLRSVSVEASDVLLNITGESVGRCCQVPDRVLPARVSQHVSIVRPISKRLDPHYLRYWLVSPEIQAELAGLSSAGATRRALTKGMIEALEIEPPPLAEQRGIAAILGALDDKIDLNRQMNRTLEAIAQAIFKSWFIDFDGHTDLVDSPLGPIPVGWKVAKIADFVDVIDCLHSKKPERQAIGKPLLQLWNILENGLLDLTDPYWVSADDYRKWITRIEAQVGDCVVTNVGRVGAVAQVPTGLRAALGRNMTAMRCRPSFPYPTFLLQLMLSPAMAAEITRKTDTGTILDALNVRSIGLLRFAQGPDQRLAEYEALVRPIRARMEANLAESGTLAALRDTLLPKLISGEIRVPEAESAVMEAP